MQIEDRIRVLQNHLQQLQAQRQQAATQVAVGYYDQFLAWSQRQLAHEQETKQRIAAANQLLEQARDEVLQRHLRVRSLKFLHDRAVATEQRKGDRRQQQQNDELAVRSWLEEVSA